MDAMSGIALGGGLLGSLFGGTSEPELPPELRRIYRMLMQRSKQASRYGAGIPGSDPQEQAVMAQTKAAAGQQFGGMRDNLMAGLRDSDAGNVPDFMQNVTAQNQGLMSGIDSDLLMQFLGQRKNARFNLAPGLAQQAAGVASGGYQQQPTGFEALAPLLGQLAYGMMRKSPSMPGTTYGGGTSGGSPPFYPHSGSIL